MSYYPPQNAYYNGVQQGYQQQQQQGYPPQQQVYSGGYNPQQGYPGGYFPQQGYGGQNYNHPPPQNGPYSYNNPTQHVQGGSGYGGHMPSQPNGYPRPNFNSAQFNGNGAVRPPSFSPQQFGNGAPSNYQFVPSDMSGKRKALLIGINYFGQRGELKGCINDVKNMSTYLIMNFRYRKEDMVLLTDDQHSPMSQPTRENILRAMRWLVKDAQKNDSLFFHYSGHGGQTPDLDGDEDDGYDEVIYPSDFRSRGHIVDDEMHAIMVKSLPPGVRLTAIFDSCHSGSALDLPYIYSTQGVVKEPDLAKEAGRGLLSIVSSYARGDVGGIASTAMGLFRKATSGNATYERAKQTKTSPADVIMLSGSKDSQTSSDAMINNEATGAMSWAFITALKKNPHQSYIQLLNSIRDELEGKYAQKPQLSASHPIDVDVLFVG